MNTHTGSTTMVQASTLGPMIEEAKTKLLRKQPTGLATSVKNFSTGAKPNDELLSNTGALA